MARFLGLWVDVAGGKAVVEAPYRLARLDGYVALLLEPRVYRVGEEREVLGMLDELSERELEGMRRELAARPCVAVVHAERSEVAGDHVARLVDGLQLVDVVECLLERGLHLPLPRLGLVEVDAERLLLDDGRPVAQPRIDESAVVQMMLVDSRMDIGVAQGVLQLYPELDRLPLLIAAILPSLGELLQFLLGSSHENSQPSD